MRLVNECRLEIPVVATIARSQQLIYTGMANSMPMDSRCGNGSSNDDDSPLEAAFNYSVWPAPSLT